MEKEASLYHQLIEHPFIVFLVGSLLLLALVSLFGMWVHRRGREKEERSTNNNRSESDTKSGK